MKVLSIAAFGPVMSDIDKSRELYVKTLGLQLNEEQNHYFHGLEIMKEFTLMPLSMAAQICFEKDAWPDGIPAPISWIEFDVDDVEAATKEIEKIGCQIFVANKESWGQKVTWFLSPEGILTKIATPPDHK